MSWAANWYKAGDVTVGKESVTVGIDSVQSVEISNDGDSVVIGRVTPESVIIDDNETEITVSCEMVSVNI